MPRTYHIWPGDDGGRFYCGAPEAPEHDITFMMAAVTCRACQSRFLRRIQRDEWLDAATRAALKTFIAALPSITGVEWNPPDLTVDGMVTDETRAALAAKLHDAPPFYLSMVDESSTAVLAAQDGVE